MTRRRAGLILPLFSSPSFASWGVGEIPDIEPMARWMADAGLGAWQMLPVNEMASGQQSPYSAISAMAIDPIFIRVPDVPDFDALGGEAALSAGDRDALARARQAPHVHHAAVRRLKSAALRAAFDRFLAVEWRCNTPRARALRDFISAQAWWIEDYGLFRAIHAREDERPWTDWPEVLQR